MSENKYDKMSDFVQSIFHVFKLVNKKAENQHDKRLKMIGLTIYNYVRKIANDINMDLNTINDTDSINLIPIFEYITYNNIQLYDFSKINVNDVDVTKREDLEKFVLTHIYYITQPEKL
jgi:hypothetical protein